MKKAGGERRIPLLYQCPSKHTHFTDPGIKRFNSGALKGVFLVFKKECLSEAGLGAGKRGKRRGEKEGGDTQRHLKR